MPRTTRPMTRIKPKTYDVIVDFKSLESIKRAMDKCSIFFFKCFLTNEFIEREFDNHNMLIDLQYDMLNKANLALDMLNQALNCHKAKSWDKLHEKIKKQFSVNFELYCREFDEIGKECAKQRVKFRKTMVPVGHG
jgi:hypothetical protein